MNPKQEKSKVKLKWRYLPLYMLIGVVRIFMKGAVKYTDFGWMECVRENPDDYKDALIRHIERYQAGELRSKDLKELHTDHIACNALILSWYENQKS